MVKSLWWHWHLAPAYIWTVAIFILSLLSPDSLPKTEVTFSDKIAHFGAYGLLAFLFLWGTKNEQTKKNIRNYFFMIFLLVSLYGMFMEIAQYTLTTTRNFDFYDALANIIGSLLGVFLFKIIFLNRN